MITMMRRMFTARHRRVYLVILTVFCACILLIWDNKETSGEQDLQLSQKVRAQLVEINKKFEETSAHSIPNTAISAKLDIHVSDIKDQDVNLCTGSPWQDLRSVPSFVFSPVVSLRHGLLYCPVGKVGSSYFTRIMIALGLPRLPGEPIASPFTIPITEAGRDRCNSLDTLRSHEEKLAFLKKSELLVFGRDPYRRIFSAWLDKLYSPNPFFWIQWGSRAARSKDRNSCKPDVTFDQFVRLVVRRNGLHRSDVHLRPVAEECKMCELHYTLLGKIETTTKDLEILASRINVSLPFLHEADYQEATAIDTVLDAVQGAFSWRDSIEACGVSLDRMGRSIWRKLQIRGVFDIHQIYPFKQEDMRHIPAQMFIDACKVAIQRSTDRRKLKQQKEVALVQAYSRVDPTDLAEIVHVYHKDFLLFGYDSKPDILFNNKSVTASATTESKGETTDPFDWSKDWIF